MNQPISSGCPEGPHVAPAAPEQEAARPDEPIRPRGADSEDAIEVGAGPLPEEEIEADLLPEGYEPL